MGLGLVLYYQQVYINTQNSLQSYFLNITKSINSNKLFNFNIAHPSKSIYCISNSNLKLNKFNEVLNLNINLNKYIKNYFSTTSFHNNTVDNTNTVYINIIQSPNESNINNKLVTIVFTHGSDTTTNFSIHNGSAYHVNPNKGIKPSKIINITQKMSNNIVKDNDFNQGLQSFSITEKNFIQSVTEDQLLEIQVEKHLLWVQSKKIVSEPLY